MRELPPIVRSMCTWERIQYFQLLIELGIDIEKATDEQLIKAAEIFRLRVVGYYHPEISERA